MACAAILDSRHTLEVDQETLLVELGLLETERVDNVVDLDLGVLESLLSLLSGSVGTSVCEESILALCCCFFEGALQRRVESCVAEMPTYRRGQRPQ